MAMKNIFVFGQDDFDLAQMQSLRHADQYCFHELYRHEDIKGGAEFPVEQLLAGAQQQLNSFTGSIDAIVGFWDFPVSTMLPLLRKPYGLPSPSFESVLKCEHKYWSRVIQQKSIPQAVPGFCAVDPFADNPRQQISLDYPFWIKPIKAANSHLGFKVHNDAEFEHAIEQIRGNIFRYGDPFNYLLQFAELPAEISAIDGNHCIAEQIISRGRQCTLEGYVYNKQVHVYGTVDSIREGQHRSSFSRYQYPSTLPGRIQQCMIDLACRVLLDIGYDNAPFNMEFYWDSSHDQIWLLEINTRISKSHCPLFYHVDGAYHHQVNIELALGQLPDFPHRQGQYKLAAKFMWREYTNARVTGVPSPEELARICQQIPSAEIQLHVHDGMVLSDLKDQDSYSYEVAVIFLAANSQKELLEKYRACKKSMHLELEPVP